MGRKLNTLVFCPEPNCTQHFSTKDELDQHLLGDAHSVIQLSSSMDHVKQRYINQLNNNIYQKQELSNSAMVSRASRPISEVPMPSVFKFDQGWALMKRVNFRYTKTQNAVLYKIFIYGEKSGRKMTPEQAARHIRDFKLLPVEHYVTPKQIR